MSPHRWRNQTSELKATFLEERALIATHKLTSIESARQRRGVLCYIPLAACSLPPPPSLLVACRSPRSPPAFMPRYCHTNSKQSICIMCNSTEEDVAQRIQAQPRNFQSCFPRSAEPPPPAPLDAAGNVGPRRPLWFLPLNRPLEALKSALRMIQQWQFSLKDHQQTLWRCCSCGPSRGPPDDFSDKHTFHLYWCETSAANQAPQTYVWKGMARPLSPSPLVIVGRALL